jgi:hypothetical protein
LSTKPSYLFIFIWWNAKLNKCALLGKGKVAAVLIADSSQSRFFDNRGKRFTTVFDGITTKMVFGGSLRYFAATF